MKRIDRLTEAQKARFPEWVEKWKKIGLSTEPADRERFEAAIEVAYKKASLTPPKKVVWVNSPLVLAFAAPLAASIVEHFNAPLSNGDAVRGAVRGAVHGAVGDSVRDAVHGAVRGAVHDAVHGAVRGVVRDAVGGAVLDAVRGAVRDVVRDAVDDAVDGAVDGAVGGAVLDAVHGAVGGAVRDAVGGAVHGAVGDAKTIISANWQSYIGGQFWVGGWWWGSPAYVSFFTKVCGLELTGDIQSRADSYAALCSSASWFWPHQDFVMVCERPAAIHLDVNGRLHNETGPAFLCRDGWGFHAWHGIRVTPEIIEKPITVQQINSETNQEIKRVMLEKYGLARYIRDAGLKEIQADRYGRLFNLPGAQFPIVLVKNSTAEPDGSFKDYVLVAARRDVKTAHAAVASTFGLTAEQYNPVHES